MGLLDENALSSLSRPAFDAAALNLDLMNLRIASRAETACESIIDAIREFEASLDSDHEVALHLASFGQSILLNVERIENDGSFLLVFRGRIKGQSATLVQSVSQLNFLLMAVPKEDPAGPPRRIGFAAD